MSKITKKIINAFLTRKTVKTYDDKINKIYNSLNSHKQIINISANDIAAHKKKWNDFGVTVKPLWLKVFSSVNKKVDINYVPESIYYSEIEPRLNNRMLALSYSDKNFYDTYYTSADLFPETVLRKIDGVIYTKEFKPRVLNKNEFEQLLSPNEVLVLKDTLDTGGGVSVKLFERTNDKFIDKLSGEELTPEFLEKNYGRDFVLQKFISQHPFFAAFNTSSLNTLRIFTYRSVTSEEIIILHSVIRIGKTGSVVDNQASGGISCGIDRTGKLNDFAIDKFGKKQSESNGIKFSEAGKVPMFEEMSAVVTEIAAQNYYSRLLGFDITIDSSNKIRIIEINNSNMEINFLQMNNGSLFGSYTDEVINYCLNNTKSICLDFRI